MEQTNVSQLLLIILVELLCCDVTSEKLQQNNELLGETSRKLKTLHPIISFVMLNVKKQVAPKLQGLGGRGHRSGGDHLLF